MGVKRSRTAVVKKLDEWFSKYVRLSNSVDGQCICYTCGTKKPWNKGIQAGHFQSRGKYSTRWDEDNVRPQCVGCNMFKQGQQWEFGRKLNLERPGLADELVERGHTLRKFSTAELEEMETYYREQVKRLLE